MFCFDAPRGLHRLTLFRDIGSGGGGGGLIGEIAIAYGVIEAAL